MANKRMFDISIITSDAFLNLSPKQQCLYIQLSMKADDDGIVNNTKSIQILTKTKQNDIKSLQDAKFIYIIDYVVVIKHWHINNSIRQDRKKPTNYKRILTQLYIDNEGIYRLKIDNQMTTTCQPNDNQMTTKCPHSIVENSIDKNNKRKYIKEKDEIDNQLKEAELYLKGLKNG